ncbi:hypothetical protein BVC80_1707g130 [Macleaya cordata]|uniref:Uncharacterized protein n=1 Tax=Macleaya cordata TaxID=56857 RepID=A0A200Q6D0_MACCD|nr:hypothetical protein BVC80_1707g130 [Macleaya cordata]
MPQVDLETLVCGGGEQKIACETQIDGDLSSPEEPTPPDFPAESFYLSKEDELDWFDRNAFYERKESTKGNSANSISNNTNSNSTTTSTSQRFSLNLKSKTSIIGLPKAPQNSTYTSCKFRHNNGKPSNARFFPKRSRSSGKSSVPETTEPSSPKVSCIGRVRSRRQRLRQLSKNRSTTVRSDKTVGFWGNFKAVLCLRCRETQAVNIVEGSTESPATPSQKSEKRKSLSPSPTTELPPGMNELKRFASGRRYDSLGSGGGGNLEIDESDSADRGRRETGPHRGN